MDKILEITALDVSYGEVQALHSLSLSVPRGQCVCLIGANGAGKSTTLKAVSGLLRPSKGAIRFQGAATAGVPPHHLVAQGLVLVPEGRGIFPELSVWENLDLGAYTRRDRADVGRDLDWALSLFPRLRERLKQKAGTLSGGEQQMLAMARALMARPQLLMLDEPSLGLAPQVVELILETVLSICRQGCSILLVEQNAAAALEISHYAYVLETGKLALEGPAADVAKDERVRQAYLGG